jgi:hypothetical protein
LLGSSMKLVIPAIYSVTYGIAWHSADQPDF